MTTTKAALGLSMAASIVSGALQLCLVPLYVRFMGLEAWGLIGFQTAVIGIMQIFDFGMAATLNRSLATYHSEDGDVHTLFRAIEALYLVEAAIIVTAIVAGSSWLADSWLPPSTLPKGDIRMAIVAMSGVLFGQWMIGLYAAGLLGLERYQQAAVLKVAGVVLAHSGSVVTLLITGGSLVAYVAWQCTAAILIALIYRSLVIRCLPARQGLGFLQVLRRHWRFASGMAVIGITAVLVMNLDKVILSRLLSLEEFGHYNLALAVVGGLVYIITPVYNITQPRLSALCSSGAGDRTALQACYLQRSQLMAWLVLPAAAVIMCEAHPLILAWTGREALAASVAPLAAIAACGTAANALMYIPYSLQIAQKRTGISIVLNMGMMATMVIGLIMVVPHWGAIGGASTWASCNMLYLLIGLPLTHIMLLPGIGRKWCGAVIPVACAAFFLPVMLALWPHLLDLPRAALALGLAALVMASLIGASFFARTVLPGGPIAAIMKVVKLGHL